MSWRSDIPADAMVVSRVPPGGRDTLGSGSPRIAAAALLVSVGLHLAGAALVPSMAVPPLRLQQTRVVLVQLVPAGERLAWAGDGREAGGGAPSGPASGLSAGGGRGSGAGAALTPDPVPPPVDVVATPSTESLRIPQGDGSGPASGTGGGAGDGSGTGTAAGSGDGAGTGTRRGALGFVVYDQKPVLLHFAAARYPAAARGAKGTVLVSVLVAATGAVADAVVARGVHPLLDEEALRAARRCTFTPGRHGGVPTPAWITLSYSFRQP